MEQSSDLTRPYLVNRAKQASVWLYLFAALLAHLVLFGSIVGWALIEPLSQSQNDPIEVQLISFAPATSEEVTPAMSDLDPGAAEPAAQPAPESQPETPLQPVEQQPLPDQTPEPERLPMPEPDPLPPLPEPLPEPVPPVQEPLPDQISESEAPSPPPSPAEPDPLPPLEPEPPPAPEKPEPVAAPVPAASKPPPAPRSVPKEVPSPVPNPVPNTTPPPTPPKPQTRGAGGSTAESVAAKASTAASFDAAYLNNPAPRYPIRAFRQKAQGTVIVRAEVLPDGKSGKVMLHQSSGYESLDAAAVDTVRKWRFQPATDEGKPVKQWVNIPITFKLTER